VITIHGVHAARCFGTGVTAGNLFTVLSGEGTDVGSIHMGIHLRDDRDVLHDIRCRCTVRNNLRGCDPMGLFGNGFVCGVMVVFILICVVVVAFGGCCERDDP